MIPGRTRKRLSYSGNFSFNFSIKNGLSGLGPIRLISPRKTLINCGSSSILYFLNIFPNGKTGDATYGTAADVAFYNDGECYASKKDVMLLNSSDGAPGSDAGDMILMELDPFDSIQMEDNYMLETEDGEAILLETQDNVGTSSAILFETGSQDADGVLKIRVNGEDKYIQLYNYSVQ